MNTLAYLIIRGSGWPNLILNLLIQLLILALLFFLVEWVLGIIGIAIPQKVKQILSALLVLLLIASLFTGCASYEKSVAGRSDAISGYSKDGGYGGAISHTVTYR